MKTLIPLPVVFWFFNSVTCQYQATEMVTRTFLLIFVMITLRLGCVAAMEMGVPSAATPPGAAMFVLGDSSVDCGDNNPFNGVLHQNLSRFPCNGTDTTLLPQLLAMKMGLPYTTPFYTQNSSINVILGGVNFGSAEATILYPGSRNYQSLNQQLRQAFETIQLLQLQLGEAAANSFINSSIFYLSFGKDDFTDFFHNNSMGNGSFTRILVHQMANAIRSLYTYNARKIVCAGVLPLGCAPHSGKACLDEVNNMVQDYNRLLEENIVAIDAELPGTSIVFCDVYRGVMEFIENPEKYGIKDVRNACCGGVGEGEGEVSGCVSTEMACREASSYVWWDLYNPTPTINSLLADAAWSDHLTSSICRPYSLRHLLSSSP